MIYHECEHFGSARTLVTNGSRRDHTASSFCFIQRIIRVRVKNTWYESNINVQIKR